MKNDPQKTLEGLLDDGKGFVQDVKKNPKKAWRNLVDSGKDLAGSAKKDVLKAVDTVPGPAARIFTPAWAKTPKALQVTFLTGGKKSLIRSPEKRQWKKGYPKALNPFPIV